MVVADLKAGRPPETATRIRGLIVEIKVTPLDAKRGGEVRVDLEGSLDDLLRVVLTEPEEAQKSAVSGTMITVVAGRGFEPLTFRL